MSSLKYEYEKHKRDMHAARDRMYSVLETMIQTGEAKRIEGPDEPGYPQGIIFCENEELLNKIVAWDIDDNADLVFYFDKGDEPHRCDNVELW